MSGRQWVSVERSITTTNIGSSWCAPAVILAILFLGASHVLALDRMGPAAGLLGQGKFSVGLDYASSDTDLKASGHSVDTSLNMIHETFVISQRSRKHVVAMNGVDMERFYATIGYGLSERTDVYFRLGGAQMGWSDDEGTSLALGGGIRSTFYSTDRLQIGGLAQISWSEVDFDAISFPNPFSDMQVTMHGDLSLYEIQLALAASYLLTDSLVIYGGPFLYFASGDLDLRKDGTWGIRVPESRGLSLVNSYDLEETSRLGGYIGAQYKIIQGMTWGIEYQYTADADAVTTGLAWRL